MPACRHMEVTVHYDGKIDQSISATFGTCKACGAHLVHEMGDGWSNARERRTMTPEEVARYVPRALVPA